LRALRFDRLCLPTDCAKSPITLYVKQTVMLVGVAEDVSLALLPIAPLSKLSLYEAFDIGEQIGEVVVIRNLAFRNGQANGSEQRHWLF
jgi:hypothetical protein